MAVSFVSPLFWQIEFIVQNGLASKKEVKTSVAELDKLVELYGHDARVFLVRSLFAVIDFRKEHHSHQQHQVNLLSQTMIQLSTQPNFGTILCLALTGDGTVNSNGQPGKQGPIDQSFIGSLCRVLKLPVPQRIIIGVALAGWDAHDDISVSGKNFLAATLLDISEKERKEKKDNKEKKENVSGGGATDDSKSPLLSKVPAPVLHQLAHTMMVQHARGEESKQGDNATNAVLRAALASRSDGTATALMLLRRDSDLYMSSLNDNEKTNAERQVTRLVSNPLSLIDATASIASTASTASTASIATSSSSSSATSNMDQLRAKVEASINIADVLVDLGYAATESNNAFREVLSICNVQLTSEDVARMLVAMSTYGGASHSSTSSRPERQGLSKQKNVPKVSRRPRLFGGVFFSCSFVIFVLFSGPLTTLPLFNVVAPVHRPPPPGRRIGDRERRRGIGQCVARDDEWCVG